MQFLPQDVSTKEVLGLIQNNDKEIGHDITTNFQNVVQN
jgi:hypothetical protein